MHGRRRQMENFMDTFREILREEDLKLCVVADHSTCDAAYLRRLYWGERANPSAQTCEQIGYAIGVAKNLDYDTMVGITNRLLAAAGFAPLQVHRRRRQAAVAAVR
jgi:hypothetical protein